MKIRVLVILVLLSSIIISCTSTDVEKISTVTVTSIPTGESYEVELTHSVIIPLTKSGAIFIMEECYAGYNSSLGEPELIDENWVFNCCDEILYYKITVNRNDGNVTITEFG